MGQWNEGEKKIKISLGDCATMEATPAPESPENEPPAPTSVSSHKGNSSGVGTPERPDLSPRALREQLRIPEPDPKAARWPNDLRTADVIVLFQPSHQTFYLHRTVLATGSGFFQSAFSSGFKDSTSGYFEVSMRNSDLAIRSCIQFLYDEFSENEPDEEAPRLVQSVGAGSKTIDLLQAADFFDMPRLIDVCCERPLTLTVILSLSICLRRSWRNSQRMIRCLLASEDHSKLGRDRGIKRPARIDRKICGAAPHRRGLPFGEECAAPVLTIRPKDSKCLNIFDTHQVDAVNLLTSCKLSNCEIYRSSVRQKRSASRSLFFDLFGSDRTKKS
ncbi:hypothetical protein DFJ73DRAFT_356192 [Zopfochytrium polystomum]|nr:hypothetical protein DFJ73DRAFT_356192 [Zopfochytrium polystomum]